MINYKKYIFKEFECDVWQTLKRSKLPILIYGMGNGADKIISVFESYGIEYADVFASDGFVRGHSYRGKRVLSYSEACEIYKDEFDIVVSFGTKLPDVIERICALEEKHRVFLPALILSMVISSATGCILSLEFTAIRSLAITPSPNFSSIIGKNTDGRMLPIIEPNPRAEDNDALS